MSGVQPIRFRRVPRRHTEEFIGQPSGIVEIHDGRSAILGRDRGSGRLSPTSKAIHRIWLRLRALPEETILGFDDRLAEVLQRLDHRGIAKQKWRDVSEPRWLPRIPGISADGFLYARCAAVLQGPETVAAIVADHRHFRTRWDTTAESLLFVASEAWEAATGRTYEHQTPISYETGTNPDGGWE